MNRRATIDSSAPVDAEDLYQLYTSVGWVAYTRDRDALATAIGNSTYVVTARDGNELIGLARGMSDDVSISTSRTFWLGLNGNTVEWGVPCWRTV